MRPLLFLGISLMLLASCLREPEEGDRVKYMVAQTEYDTTRINVSGNIFNTYNTFFIKLDTMGYVFGSASDDTVLIDPIKSGTTIFVSPVVDEIKSKVEMAGFTSVAEEANPDFVVKVV